MMKKVLLFAIAFVMLFSLAACGNNEDTEMMNQAKQTYLNDFLKTDNPDATINDVSFTPFLGIYNDSLVAVFYGGQYHGPQIERVVELKIEGLDFSYSYGYPILVWNSNSIVELAEAYGQGLLTKANLQAVSSLYQTTASAQQANNEENSMEIQAKQTYLDNSLKTDNPEATIDDVSFMPFLGIYNDSLVAVFYGGKYHGPQIERVVELEIEGLDFSYSYGYPILVWKNNSIISLAEAYEQGLLTKANLNTIFDLYHK